MVALWILLSPPTKSGDDIGMVGVRLCIDSRVRELIGGF